MTGDIFHLAIPTHDLDAATTFYRDVMGAEPARRYDDRQTFRFFGHQVVCHLEPGHKVPDDPLADPYPHHFGMTLASEEALATLWSRCRVAGVPHLSELTWRFNDKPERHQTFWTADPAGNVLEFKWYEKPELSY
jgi:extradiol dioxygenase family protein